MDATNFYEPKESWVQIAKRWNECGVGVSKDEEIRKEDLGKCLLWLDIGPVTKKSVGPEPKKPAQRGAKPVTTRRIKKEAKKCSDRRTRRHKMDNRPSQFVTEPLPHNHRNTIKIEIEAPGYKDTPYHYDPQIDHMDTSMPILSPYSGAYPAEAAPHFDSIFGTPLGTHQNSFAGTFGPFPIQNAPHFEPTISEAQPPIHQNQFPIFEENMIPHVQEEVTIAIEEEDNMNGEVNQNDPIPPFLKNLGIDLGVYLYDPESPEPAPQFKKKPGNSYNLYRAQWRKLGKIPVIPFRKLPDQEWRILEKAKVILDELQKDQIKKGLIRMEGPRRSRMMITMKEETN